MARTRDHARLPPYTVLALSGIPAREQLFNGSLCTGHGPVFFGAASEGGGGDYYKDSARGRAARRGPSAVRSSVPSALIVPNYHGPSGGGGSAASTSLGRLLAAQAAADGRTVTHDAILGVSTGVVSSYASDGTLNWQQRDAPSWGDGADGFLVKVPPSSTGGAHLCRKSAATARF